MVEESHTPFFSIAIPTRNRSRFARMSAARVLSQDFNDLELVILDNSDSEDLTTAEFNDVRCTVLPTESVLSMRDNWERILAVARGKFVLLLSDKDMLVPGALRMIAKAISEVDAEIVNYRKACFAREGQFQSFVQRCSGALVQKDGGAVLDAWFGNVSHYHDAPMVYNSAVRRELLMELKGVNGKFFTGTSPDIGSGLVLMARLRKYHVLDRPLVVSWYGDWSIGMAASGGARGAAAAFFSEYRDDPIRAAGLVPGVAGSVAETLLDCKKRFAALFADYDLSWSNYVRRVLEELNGREQAGVDTSAERKYLGATRGKRYSWLSARVGESQFRWHTPSRFRRFRTRVAGLTGEIAPSEREMTRTATTSVNGETHDAAIADTELNRYFASPVSATPDFQAVPYFPLPWAKSVDEVVNFAANINRRMDLVAAR